MDNYRDLGKKSKAEQEQKISHERANIMTQFIKEALDYF